MGVYYRVKVYTSSRQLCEEILGEARRVGGVGEGLELVRRFVSMHGGCRLLSRDPLIVETVDGAVRIEAVPDSPLASMLHERIVGRVLEECESAKDTALSGR